MIVGSDLKYVQLLQSTIGQLSADLAECRDALHYANGVADLAIKHRDEAESKLSSYQLERDKLAAELDDRDEYGVCDCCECLSTELIDAGGHMQCQSCTRLANLRDSVVERQERRTRVGVLPDYLADDLALSAPERQENEKLWEEGDAC